MSAAAEIPGVLLLRREVFRDPRGALSELWQDRRYLETAAEGPFRQDNVSWSHRGVLRGLHLQHPSAQGKLVSAAYGTIFDVSLDVRRGSPTFGAWAGFELSGENGLQIYLPEGVAHGFLVLSDVAVVDYKCTELYAPAAELTILWSDPDVAIAWPETPRIVSARDAAAPRLRDIPPERLPLFAAPPAHEPPPARGS